jgi:hypothetical protein
MVIGHWSLVIGQWSVVRGQWSVVSGQSSVEMVMPCLFKSKSARLWFSPPAVPDCPTNDQ